MKAKVIDFRNKSKEIISALDRQEEVELFYHGKLKAIIKPVKQLKNKRKTQSSFFGYIKDEKEPVEKIIDDFRRKPRYDF